MRVWIQLKFPNTEILNEKVRLLLKIALPDSFIRTF